MNYLETLVFIHLNICRKILFVRKIDFSVIEYKFIGLNGCKSFLPNTISLMSKKHKKGMNRTRSFTISLLNILLNFPDISFLFVKWKWYFKKNAKKIEICAALLMTIPPKCFYLLQVPYRACE